MRELEQRLRERYLRMAMLGELSLGARSWGQLAALPLYAQAPVELEAVVRALLAEGLAAERSDGVGLTGAGLAAHEVAATGWLSLFASPAARALQSWHRHQGTRRPAGQRCLEAYAVELLWVLEEIPWGGGRLRAVTEHQRWRRASSGAPQFARDLTDELERIAEVPAEARARFRARLSAVMGPGSPYFGLVRPDDVACVREVHAGTVRARALACSDCAQAYWRLQGDPRALRGSACGECGQRWRSVATDAWLDPLWLVD